MKSRVFPFLALLLAYVFCSRVEALDIIPYFDSSITSDPDADKIVTTIRAVCFEYKYRIADAGTVRLLMKKMDAGLGQSMAGGAYEVYPTYTQVYSKLASHQTTALDFLAVGSLPASGNNPVNNSIHMRVKLALARVFGLTTNTFAYTNLPLVDNQLSFNTAICALAPGDSLIGKYSLYATVCHEVDEALGTGSALDGVTNGAATPTGPASLSDLFRRDENGNRSFSTSASEQAFFYIPGYGPIRRFNQTQGGDFGDWAGDGAPRLQDAFATPNNDPRLQEEILELDVIGYTMLPEPVWLDLNGNFSTEAGHYFYPYTTESQAAAGVEPGGAIMFVGNSTLHYSRIDASTYGKPVRLATFNGTTRIVP